MLASRLSQNQKKGFSGIVLPLVNSHFYEAKKRCHDNQLQHLSWSRDSEEVSLMTKSGRIDDIEASSPPNTSLEQIRVVIADDHPVARQGLSAILGSLDDVKVVAEAADGEEACKLYHQHSPDVLIVDLRMPKKDGLRVVEELMSGGPPKPRIIVITTYEDEEDIRRALTAGAKGYLVKAADSEQIEETLRAVAAGGSLFPPAITLKLVEAVAHPELSKRERQVLEYLANGRSNKEIGAILYVSELTVKGHVRSILEKLDAKGRSEAIAIALKRGLIRANV
jgi:two-component system, NarL family, response regulator